jgi:hypothetical protein
LPPSRNAPLMPVSPILPGPEVQKYLSGSAHATCLCSGGVAIHLEIIQVSCAQLPRACSMQTATSLAAGAAAPPTASCQLLCLCQFGAPPDSCWAEADCAPSGTMPWARYSVLTMNSIPGFNLLISSFTKSCRSVQLFMCPSLWRKTQVLLC